MEKSAEKRTSREGNYPGHISRDGGGGILHLWVLREKTDKGQTGTDSCRRRKKKKIYDVGEMERKVEGKQE